jgi:2'-5' RNA ligase
MRLFVALELPENERQRLAELTQQHADIAHGSLSWVRAQNLHITLKFLGETPDQQLTHVREALAKVPFRNPLHLNIEGFTFFPPGGPARVFVAECSGDVEEVCVLQADIERTLISLGVEPEHRRFRPHVTLARVRRNRRLPQAVCKRLSQLQLQSSQPFVIDGFVLMRSHLKPDGAVYECVNRFPVSSMRPPT